MRYIVCLWLLAALLVSIGTVSGKFAAQPTKQNKISSPATTVQVPPEEPGSARPSISMKKQHKHPRHDTPQDDFGIPRHVRQPAIETEEAYNKFVENYISRLAHFTRVRLMGEEQLSDNKEYFLLPKEYTELHSILQATTYATDVKGHTIANLFKSTAHRENNRNYHLSVAATIATRFILRYFTKGHFGEAVIFLESLELFYSQLAELRPDFVLFIEKKLSPCITIFADRVPGQILLEDESPGSVDASRIQLPPDSRPSVTISSPLNEYHQETLTVDNSEFEKRKAAAFTAAKKGDILQ